MCLAVIALDAHPRYMLVVAANRDEFHSRAAQPAAWGTAPPFTEVLAGRDLAAGGTWLGVRRDGRWALLTNVREGGSRDATLRSRGELVPRVLAGGDDPLAGLRSLATDGAEFNGFNLLTGRGHNAAWMSNRAPHPARLAPGVHGLSNALLDTPWPKLQRTTARLRAWATRGEPESSIVFEWLADRERAPDETLPATGITLEQERMLSAPFILSDHYGTRCSTVFTIDRSGLARFRERSFDPRGEVIGDVEFNFATGAGGGAVQRA